MTSKVCRVCGDVAVGFNYSVLSCLSCKVFFHRNSAKHQKLTCIRQSDDCPVAQTSRSCTACRLAKCRSVGMTRYSEVSDTASTTASSTTRLAQLKLGVDRVLEMAIHREIYPPPNSSPISQPSPIAKLPKIKPSLLPLTAEPWHSFTAYETTLISEIQDALTVFPDEWSAPTQILADSMTTFFDIPELYFSCLMSFCQKIAPFRAIPPEDQLGIVKRYCFDMLFSRFIFLYSPQQDGYPMVSSRDCPVATFIPMSLFDGLEPREAILEYVTFYREYKGEMGNDRTLFGLLSAQLMFAPREGLAHCGVYLAYGHTKYSRLLRKYLLVTETTQEEEAAQAKYRRLMRLTGQLQRMKDIEVDMFEKMDLLQVPHIMVEVYSVDRELATRTPAPKEYRDGNNNNNKTGGEAQ